MKFILLPLLPLMMVFYSYRNPREEALSQQDLPFRLELNIEAKYDHDVHDFTQGYEFFDNVLYESTGLNGQSKVKMIDPETWQVKKMWNIPREFFGEGCTIFEGKLYVLTWKKRKVFIFDLSREEFIPEKIVDLPKGKGTPREGWGLTHDGQNLILSDGSNYLFFLDPNDLTVVKKLRVFKKTKGTEFPVKNLNELEYIGDYIWANVWYDSRIVIIDPNSGEIRHEIDFKKHFPDMSMLNYRQKSGAVLNGIAYHADTDTVYLTGKSWPKIFEVDNPFGKGREFALKAASN